jgi:hypothetical protein
MRKAQRRGYSDRTPLLNEVIRLGSKCFPLPVEFRIEGRRVAHIGAFDASRPLAPNQIMHPS